jgi:hypothetical protein
MMADPGRASGPQARGPVQALGRQPFAQPLEAPGTARHFSFVQVAPLAQAFIQGVQPGQLMVAQALLLGGGEAPQSRHESRICLHGPLEAESPGDASERPALLSERHYFTVALRTARRSSRTSSSKIFSRLGSARWPPGWVARARRHSGLTRLACGPLGPCSASKSTFCPSASSR